MDSVSDGLAADRPTPSRGVRRAGWIDALVAGFNRRDGAIPMSDAKTVAAGLLALALAGCDYFRAPEICHKETVYYDPNGNGIYRVKGNGLGHPMRCTTIERTKEQANEG